MKNLESFTQPEILQQIGSRRLAKLFDCFRDDLKTGNILLPNSESENGSYFDSLAPILGSSTLPDRLRAALFTLEAAARSENQDRLDSAIQRRIPCVSLSPCCALDRALELWFHAPDELSQFQTNHVPSENAASQAPSIEHSEPSTEHGGTDAAPVALEADAQPQESSRKDESRITHHVPCNDVTVQPCNVPPPPPNPTIHESNSPLIQPAANPSIQSASPFASAVDPWPQPVAARLLLDALRELLKRFVVLPRWAAETLALWILHTYAFELRDISTYIGIESPQRRCGKTTLLTILCQLVNRPVVAANVTSPSFFRAIEELRPTLMIDEADRFLKGKHELQGILNAGYSRKTAFVLRVGQPLPKSESKNHPSTLAFFSCWCPKLISQIGRLPDTLADRCIVIRMQRKTPHEKCERLRNLDTMALRRQCARFVLDNKDAIASARPQIPARLNDRAADIWEPLLALADLAGGEWPELARQAALSLSDSANENNLIGPLLLDIMLLFISSKADRMFTRDLLAGLNNRLHRPWAETLKGKPITEQWLAQQLRPYGVKPRTLWLNGAQAKGYFSQEFTDIFQRYISQSELDALKQESEEPPPSATNNGSGQSAGL